MTTIKIDLSSDQVTLEDDNGSLAYPMNSPEAFALVSKAWLRCGWDTKYVYTFSWLGRPVIQLPDDLIRIQEVIYRLKPDVLIETGVAHGGSLIFYASLFKAMNRGRVIGIDIEIRPHNRKAIEEHELFDYITLIEGNAIDREVVERAKSLVSHGESIMVVLDSKHTKDHVLGELNAYADLVSSGFYIVATDGIMKDLVGAPRSQPDWEDNNPYMAVVEFLKQRNDFILDSPGFLFNESNGISEHLTTYWPGAWLKKK
ncbi:MAG: cephalosporin hydroxylase family protein [Cyanosarcina radialis HA8281-LM2]|jgi:cephalosporin hydroxylase|nr:cephalosporin hydroxylase family protein [Cyanosarcina radialis HA8281-LM2]